MSITHTRLLLTFYMFSFFSYGLVAPCAPTLLSTMHACMHSAVASHILYL